MELLLDEPRWLWLLIPVAAYFIFTSYRMFKTAAKPFRIIFFLRIAAILCLLFALAEPSIFRAQAKEQIIFLIDRSASMDGTEKELATAIEKAMGGKETSQLVGVYSFAEDFQTLLPLSQKFKSLPLDVVQSSQVQTNIEQAIDLAANSGESNYATRIVLLSDGNETRGTAIDSLARLTGGRVQIDVLPIKQKATGDAAIASFETPATAFLGEAQPFQVTLQSGHEAQGELVFSLNDQEFARKDVSLAAGQNLFSYTFPATREGLAKYEARFEIAEDGFIENNAMVSLTEVEGNPHLLVVSGDESSPIVELVDKRNVQITEIPSNELPSNLSSILKYDAIIFDNVSGTAVGTQQMNVIEQAVQLFGVGFMMVGGDQSFGLGGYFKTPIERILPVEMEVKGKHELPSLGLVIVMDRSGSMSGLKMELAKEAAARSLELLRKDDTVGVIAFDDRPWQIIPTEKLDDPKAAIEKVLSVSPGGGTEIYASLEEAYSQLEGLKLQRKHIILLTDGQSATSNDYDALIEEGKEKNITLSTVSIGEDADKGLLESLAITGSGRYYDVFDATTIPAILSRETIMMSRTYIVDEPFYPKIYTSNWADLFSEGIPEMNAYIATTAKSTALIALESDQGDPVLAKWNYGLGLTAAYTSGSGSWSGGFQSWENWPAFWNRTVSELLPSFEEIPFSVTSKGQGVYTVEDPSRQSAIIDVTAIDEQGNQVPVLTEPIGPGQVEITIDANPGLVFFGISNENGDSFKTGQTVPYGEEYRISEPNMQMLTALAEGSGGQVLESLEPVFRDIPFTSGARQPIQQVLILFAMLFFFIDITIRRFGLKSPSFKVKKGFSETAPSSSVDQLIKAKKR